MRSLLGKLVVLAPLAVSLAGSCRPETPAFHPIPNESPASCEARRTDFSRFVAALPERPIRLDVATELPVSTLGVPPGVGSVLEVTERTTRLDGTAVHREDLAARLADVRGPLYVAAPPATTIAELRKVLTETPKSAEPRLLVRTERSAGAFLAVPGASERSRELASALIAERDPKERTALAKQAYAELNACPAIANSVASVDGLRVGDRWPALKKSLSDAVPQCPCTSLDTAGLSVLLLAEQRAGTAALGALPLAFLRDERCGATMPLRSLARLLEQIEQFDADYAGRFTDDALRFESIVTNDRLLVQFCDALPGETLASLEKAKRTLWVRSSSGACDGFRFEPLAPGAPMGTLRRTQPSSPALAFHYWQAAEEIGVFGPIPADGSTKPTDQREWPCRVNYKLTGIEPDFVSLEAGRWFFTESACREAGADSVGRGCLGDLAGISVP
ncbi:MAG TPA: hypothetical protein VMS65_13840 [Polyangiaceae bacterium]|nr:hypothetical protein [Polyangiaceae bacterium]